MDYEKKYKDALELAKDYFKANQKLGELEENDMLSDIFPELAESEDEKIRKALIRFHKSSIDIDGIKGDDILAWLEKQGDKSVNIDIESMVSSYKQRLKSQGGIENSPLVNMCLTAFRRGVENTLEELNLKKLEKKGEQKPSEWHREDEQNLNACLGYIPDEFLRRWLTDIIHVKYDKPTELPKGEDYGIDGLYAAIDILQRTLGEVDGYQSDDGILAHKCAISAVKELSKQKPAWSEGDEEIIKNIISVLDWDGAIGKKENPYQEEIDWLKSIKERRTWKPSEEQMECLCDAIKHYQTNGYPASKLSELYEQMSKIYKL